MEYEEDMVEDAIRRIIRHAPGYHVKIEGNPSEKWFVLRDAHLASVFSHSTADIMVRFEPDRRMTIFFPDYIKRNVDIEPCVCRLFLDKKLSIQGWQQVCPYLTEQVVEACLENITVLLQFIQNPILCGIHGCDQRVAYEKLLAEFAYELPRDEIEEDFEYEDDTEKHDKEDTENGYFQ